MTAPERTPPPDPPWLRLLAYATNVWCALHGQPGYAEGYERGYDAGRKAGLRKGYAAGLETPRHAAPRSGPGARELFPLAGSDPERFLFRCALIKEEHRINQARGATAGEAAG